MKRGQSILTPKFYFNFIFRSYFADCLITARGKFVKDRGSRSQMYYKIGALKNFSKFTGSAALLKGDSRTGVLREGVLRKFAKLTGKHLC